MEIGYDSRICEKRSIHSHGYRIFCTNWLSKKNTTNWSRTTYQLFIICRKNKWISRWRIYLRLQLILFCLSLDVIFCVDAMQKKNRNNGFNSVLRTVYIRNVYNQLIYTYTTCYTIEGWNCPHCQTIVSPGIADILVSQLILLRDIPRCDFLQRKIWRLRTYTICVPRILT